MENRDLCLLTCHMQRCVVADRRSNGVAREAGVNPLVGRTSPALSHAQEKEASLRQDHGLHLSVGPRRLQRLAVPEPLVADLRAAVRPARQPRRIPRFHHHVRGVMDDAGSRLLRTKPGSCGHREKPSQ